MTTLNIHISDELNDSLAISAKEIEKSKNYIVRKALEAYLPELRAGMKDRKLYSSAEVIAYIKTNCHSIEDLENMEDIEDIKDAEIALARMNDKNMKCYTSEEVEEYLKANCLP